jgi:predicted Zn-dependent protease with MMP-like domain
MRQFEEAIRTTLETVPDPFQPHLQNIEFVAARSSPQGLLGLYEGAGALGQSSWPARITVFKDSHEARSTSWDELLAELRRTLLHEIGHHFQMEEGELPF